MTDTVDELFARAFTDPASALAEAGRRLAGAVGGERVELLRVMGNAARELRRVDESVEHLQAAVATAVSLGDRRLEGLATMSLAATLSYTGDFEGSLGLAARSVELLEGEDRILALGQQAGLLARAGRHDQGLEAFTEALDATSPSTNERVLGDLWMNRGVLYGWAGEIDAAERDTCNALDVFERLGHTKRAADVRHNLAWLAGRRGDLVEAFRRFDDAERVYRALGLSGAAIFPDRSEALLAAGLTKEALALAERAVEDLEAAGDDVDVAEASILVARAALLAGDPQRAEAASAVSSRLFELQGRGGWWAAAASLHVESRLRAGVADEHDVGRIEEVISAATESGLGAASAEARVVAAELAAERGDWTGLQRHLDVLDTADLGLAARCRRSLARVGLLTAAGRVDDALLECRRAVEEFGALAAALGGTELRAHIALHVAQLVDAGLGLAVGSGDWEAALEWSERQRAAALDAAPVRPPEDRQLAGDLDRLRSVLTELDAMARDGINDQALLRESIDLQDRVRRRSRHVAGEGPPAPGADATIDLPSTDVAAWVSFVDVDGQLTALRVVDGQADVVPLGACAVTQREAALLRTTLTMHLNAVGRGIAKDPEPVLLAAADVDAAIVAPLELPPGPVAVSPIAGLHDLPWGLLPSLRHQTFTLAPSRALWQRCRARISASRAHVVVAAGPDVPLADVEAEHVAACHQESRILAGRAATVASVEEAMLGADVAHLVCHGRFSSQNPMFSSLLLADGPMFVYDLERLAPAPGVVVLSACHAGSHATPVGREILGLTASLLARGPRSVVAATVPIPDALSTVGLMTQLHTSLAAGAGAAAALVDLRRTDPVVGGAFACYGAD